MDKDIRIKKIDSTKALLKLELERVIELLETESEDLWCPSYRTFKNKSELKSKMSESRRDMIRLEKLMYDYNLE